MRNPYRIITICERLKAAWAQVPDMRLLQLLEGAGVEYYTEDDDMIVLVEKFVERMTKNT